MNEQRRRLVRARHPRRVGGEAERELRQVAHRVRHELDVGGHQLLADAAAVGTRRGRRRRRRLHLRRVGRLGELCALTLAHPLS